MAEATPPAAAQTTDPEAPKPGPKGLAPSDREKMMQEAVERERSHGRTNGPEGFAEDDGEAEQLWVHSNRQDDRVVLAEVHPMHPGGNAFVGGPGVAKVGRSPEVERLLYTGELMEVPAPPTTIKSPDGKDIPNPFYPVVQSGNGVATVTQQPGQPTLLGRQLNHEIWGDDGKKVVQDVRRRQRSMPGAINPAPGGITPPGMPGSVSERERQSRQGR